jgi:hypothetical protein
LWPPTSSDYKPSKSEAGDKAGFVEMIFDNLKTAGIQQAHKEDKIEISFIAPWPRHFVCAEGHYVEGEDAPTARNWLQGQLAEVGQSRAS